MIKCSSPAKLISAPEYFALVHGDDFSLLWLLLLDGIRNENFRLYFYLPSSSIFFVDPFNNKPVL
jgi:hypothetical protein